MQYTIHEDNMPKLLQKLKRIENKCSKYGCNFTYAEIGEEYKEVQYEKEVEGAFGQKGLVKSHTSIERFVIIEVEGTAIINDWKFIATLEHTEHGNIIRGYADFEIPTFYRTCKPTCDHCKSDRKRKDTYIIYNEKTGELKQVGKSCLMDYTNGLSVEMVAKFASYFDTILELDGAGSSGGYTRHYINTFDFLMACNDIVNKCGFVSKQMAFESDDRMVTTSSKAIDFMFYSHIKYVKDEIEKIGYNPNTEENKTEVKTMLEWLQMQDANSQYIHNLQISCKREYAEFRDCGILASLPSAYFKAMEKEADRIAREAKRAEMPKSKHVGNIGDRIVLENVSITCIAKYETMYGVTKVYKIMQDGNVFIWKSANYVDDAENINIKGSIKNHNEYNGELQTELTRCKII